MQRTRTVPELIDALGGNTAVAGIIGKRPSTVSEMKRKRSVHVRYWPRIIRAARAAKIPWVNSDALMHMHAGEGEPAR